MMTTMVMTSQNARFIRSVVPDNIILVHGGKNGMRRLKDELDRYLFLPRPARPVSISAPTANHNNNGLLFVTGISVRIGLCRATVKK